MIVAGHRASGSLDGGIDGSPGKAGLWAPGMIDLAPVLTVLCDQERERVQKRDQGRDSGLSGVAFYVVLQPLAVKADVAVLVCLAVHELLSNACIHAFPAGTVGHVGVHLWRTYQPSPRAYLLVADDGCGFGAEPPSTAGSGLALARCFLELADAQLAREPGRGTIWRIGLP